MNSVGVTQAYRSRLVAQQPKDDTEHHDAL